MDGADATAPATVAVPGASVRAAAPAAGGTIASGTGSAAGFSGADGSTAKGDVQADTRELVEAVAGLVRGDLSQLDSCLVFGEPSPISGTAAKFRCHFIRSTPNGVPRLEALAKQLAKEAIFHCIPRTAIEATRDLGFEDLHRASQELASEARRLFTKNQPNSGEGGELLLYALLEQGLGVPQILSKMSMKSNTEVQYQGTDGIHATVLSDGNLALYWGEAKIWDSLAAALTDCFKSIAPFLLQQSEEQDVWLIKQYADFGDADLKGACPPLLRRQPARIRECRSSGSVPCRLLVGGLSAPAQRPRRGQGDARAAGGGVENAGG